MTGPTFDIVCTSINDGGFLKHYAAAITEAAAQDRVRIIVIPDRKTPAALYEAVADTRAQGFRVECPDLNEQEQFLASLGAPAGMFPFDTDHRRNIGYLIAWRDGADIMVSVDDDNLPQDHWLLDHEVALQRDEHMVVSSERGFFNPCHLLWPGNGPIMPASVYARGFPYRHRSPDLTLTQVAQAAEVTINEGLWNGDPDVDAVTRLALHPVLQGTGAPYVLAPGTWAPVNSQNTAIRRDVIPAYYFFRSGRFGDIYQGYLAQACAKAMGHSVRFGTPVVTHARNDHDLLRDLELELPDILILDDWLGWLTSVKPDGSTYPDSYAWLGDAMNDVAARSDFAPGDKFGMQLMRMAAQMRHWLTLIRKIGA